MARPSKIEPYRERVIRDLADGVPTRAIGKAIGCNIETINRAVKRWEAETGEPIKRKTKRDKRTPPTTAQIEERKALERERKKVERRQAKAERELAKDRPQDATRDDELRDLIRTRDEVDVVWRACDPYANVTAYTKLLDTRTKLTKEIAALRPPAPPDPEKDPFNIAAVKKLAAMCERERKLGSQSLPKPAKGCASCAAYAKHLEIDNA